MHIKALTVALGALGKHLLDVLGRALGEAGGKVLSSNIRLEGKWGEETSRRKLDPLFLD